MKTDEVAEIRALYNTYTVRETITTQLYHERERQLAEFVKKSPGKKISDKVMDFPQSFQDINTKWYSSCVETSNLQDKLVAMLDNRALLISDDKVLVPIVDEGVNRVELMELMTE